MDRSCNVGYFLLDLRIAFSSFVFFAWHMWHIAWKPSDHTNILAMNPSHESHQVSGTQGTIWSAWMPLILRFFHSGAGYVSCTTEQQSSHL